MNISSQSWKVWREIGAISPAVFLNIEVNVWLISLLCRRWKIKTVEDQDCDLSTFSSVIYLLVQVSHTHMALNFFVQSAISLPLQICRTFNLVMVMSMFL